MFRIGQKVVCVDDEPLFGSLDGLTKGCVYTVRWAGRVNHPTVGSYTGIKVGGIKRHGLPRDLAFYASRFRPVVEKKTDISWAEEILRRESIDTPERVS